MATRKHPRRKSAAKKAKKRTIKKADVPNGLTAKRQRFVHEYCVDFNATQAAIRAGYAKSGAYQEGYRLLRIADISLAIKKYLDDLSMTSEEALQRLTSFARGTMADFIRINEAGEPVIVIPMSEDGVADPNALSLVKELKVKQHISTSKDGEEFKTTTTEFKLEDRQSAIDKLLKARRVYSDGANVKVDFGENVTINIVSG